LAAFELVVFEFFVIDLYDIRLFVFDFDGTLVRSNAIKRDTFYDIASGYAGASTLLDKLLKANPPLDRYEICHALAKRFDSADADSLADAYTTLCEKRIIAAPEVPGALKLLATLRDAGRFCAINSATPENALRKLVSRLPIAPFVHLVMGAPTGKADNIRRAMEIMDVLRQQTVMVGDGAADQHAAAEAGCAFVGVTGGNMKFPLPAPIVISRLDKLMEWL
jgi:phosphoglycolate phosphatase